MPAQSGQSKLMQKLGVEGRKAFEAHKKDETDLSSFGSLPGGIERGVAQLVDCKFGFVQQGKDNAGQPFFFAAGIVKQPVKHNGIPIVGMRTQVIEPLYSTPTRSRKTVEEHLAWVMNEMRKLGGNTASIGPDDLENMADALKAAQPHFTFRTWQGVKRKPGEQGYNEQYDGPNAPPPRVNETWNGACDYSEDDTAGVNGVVDHTAAGVGPADQADQFDEEGSQGGVDAGADAEADAETTTGENTEPANLDADDVDALGAAADGDGDDSSDAQAMLQAKAEELGIAEDDITGAANWAAVVDLIKAATSQPEPEPEPEPVKPSGIVKGSTYRYQPIDPKTKKPQIHAKTRKPYYIDVECLSSDPKKKVATVRSLEDGKTEYKGVEWSKLEVS